MEEKGKSFFRKSAIDSMVNPEELNKLIYSGISGSWVIIISIIGLIASFIIWTLFSSLPLYVDGYGVILNKSKLRPVMAGVEGIISEIEAERGDKITSHKILAKIKTEQSENFIDITSPFNGIILQEWIYPSLYVSESDLLFTVEETDFFVHPMVVAYIPNDFAGTVKPGMDVQVTVSSINENIYGFIRGKVDSVSDYQSTRELIFWETGSFQTVDYITSHSGNKKPFTSVFIKLMENTDGTYQWSQKKPSFSLETGSLCNCFIIVGKKTPLQTLINHLNY